MLQADTCNPMVAISIQRSNRLELELSHLLPNLHGLDNLLSDIPPSELSDNAQLQELELVLQSALSRVTAARRTAPSTIPTFSALAQPQASRSNVDEDRGRTTGPNKRPKPLPPSPERGQKRQDSHGIS